MTAVKKSDAKEQGKIAEIDLSFKPRPDLPDKKINSSRDAFQVMQEVWDESKVNLQEEMFVMLLSRSNKPIGYSFISRGGRAGTVVDPALVAALAVKSGAAGVILAHNHPSGNVNQSDADVRVTKRLSSGLSMLDILVLDHLIVVQDEYGNWKYQSLADEGIITYT